MLTALQLLQIATVHKYQGKQNNYILLWHMSTLYKRSKHHHNAFSHSCKCCR